MSKLPSSSDEDQRAVIIALAKTDRTNDTWNTSIVYCLEIVGDLQKDQDWRVSGKPFQLQNPNGRHTWGNHQITREYLKVGTIIYYQKASLSYLKNTKQQLNANKVLSQLQFNNQAYGGLAFQGIKEAFPKAQISHNGSVADHKSDTNSFLSEVNALVSIVVAGTVDERIVFRTQLGEQHCLKLNCRTYRQCTIDTVYLPVRAPSSEQDVGDVVLIKRESAELVCEGILIRTPVLGRYDMRKQPHGMCVIINNLNFKGKKRRKGATNDHKELEKLFKKLSYDVDVRTDLEWDKMRSVAVEFAKKDHSEFDSFVMIIMSHGGENDAIEGVDGRSIRVEDLTSEFKSSNCPTLEGKPKLFFVQACRGGLELERSSTSGDSGDDFNDDNSMDSTLPRTTCPQEADFLLAFATAPGYTACRHPKYGSVFIQVLVEVIRDCYKSYHLLDMLTHVIKLVVENGNVEAGRPIQVPAPSHTLRNQVWLGQPRGTTLSC